MSYTTEIDLLEEAVVILDFHLDTCATDFPNHV